MKKTFQTTDTRRVRDYISYVASSLYRNLMNDKSNWVLVTDFEYAAFDSGDDAPENIYGYVFKLPITINSVPYMIHISGYYNGESFNTISDQIDNSFEKIFNCDQDDRDWEDECSSFKQEWIFGNKKITYNNGGNL